MKVLVTGVDGFIGSHVAEVLLARGHAVVGMDRRAGGWVDVLRKNAPDGCFAFVHAEVQNQERIHFAHSIHGGLDVVAHLAAVANVPDSMKDWPMSAHTNAYGAACIFDSCREFSTPIVYASTAALYQDDLPLGERLHEDAHRFCARSPYAAEKLLLEKYAEVLSTSFKTAALGLRIFNVYGPRDTPATGHVVPCFMQAALANEALSVHGGGDAVRDFIYVVDVAEAFADACEILTTEKQMGCDVLNLCSGEATTILDLANRIRAMTGSGLPIDLVQQRPGDASALVGSPERFAQRFGRPAASTNLSDGLELTLKWYRQWYQRLPRPSVGTPRR